MISLYGFIEYGKVGIRHSNTHTHTNVFNTPLVSIGSIRPETTNHFEKLRRTDSGTSTARWEPVI